MTLLKKTGVVLLLLLVAGMAIVPCVSAEEHLKKVEFPQEFEDAVVTETSTVLPQLKFDATQNSVPVNDELRLEASIQRSQIISKIAAAEKPSVADIPYGAIIYHSNEGITTIFDSSGEQICKVDDSLIPMVNTPDGIAPATYVVEVPDKSFIRDEGEIVNIFYQKERILTIINEYTPNTKYQSTKLLTTDYPAPYIEGAEATPISTVGHFLAQWNVPSSPNRVHPYNGDIRQGSKITIWNGLLTADEEKLLQPVLEWYVKDKSSDPDPTPQWSIATWYVKDGVPGGVHSTRRYGIVSTGELIQPGHLIQGNMNRAGAIWNGAVSDLTLGVSSTLFLTQTQSTELSYNNLKPIFVLEGWNPEYWMIPNSLYLPGSVTFGNFIVEDIYGNNVRPASIGTFVNSQYWDPSTFGLNLINQWPNTITLQTANS